MIDIKHNGKKYINVTADGYRALGIPEEVYEVALLEKKWVSVRVKRDALIAETDWTQTLDSPLSDGKKAEFLAYRQELRDIPQAYGDPDDVVWPEKPTI